MNRNVTIFIALASVLVLGLWGQYVLDPEAFAAEFPARFYEVVMLFALEGEWTLDKTLPIQLELARLLAPMVSIAGVLIVITRGTWVQLTNSLILLWRDHLVVVGLGDKGRRFALNCRSDYNVIVIEQNPENIYIDQARNRGIKVIVGDALDPIVQRTCRLRYARHLVIFTGNDGSSVELALRFRSRANRFIPDNEPRPHIHVHVEDTEMARRMEDFSGFNIGDGPTETSFFSVEERIARLQFLGQLWAPAPDEFAQILNQDNIHIAIYGMNNLTEHLITEAVQVCHYYNHNQIQLTVFHESATEEGAALLRRYPALEHLCAIRFIDVPQIPMHLTDDIVTLFPHITEHIICLDSDNENLAIALWLRDALMNFTASNAPIHVRMQSSRGLATLLESPDDEPEWPDGIYPFGMLDDVLTAENILSDSLDQYAQALHEDYLASKREQADPRLWTTLKSWETMSESARKTNRLQADHLEAKLRAVRCHSRYGDAPTYTFTREDAEQLAIMEHRRYQAQKIFNGWSAGDERTESARVNPTIGPWEGLEPEERERQINDIMRLPTQLYSYLGKRIERKYYVGVTGHRPHRLADTPALRNEIDALLEKLATQHKDKCMVIVSPLAEGTDRIVARMAMEHHGYQLMVPLPLPWELYETDFDDASRMEFAELLGRSERYFELPLRFGTAEMLATRIDGQPNPERDSQYALVGAFLSQFCDELIAVYDGQPAAGEGGTGQVVAWRKGDIPIPQKYQHSFRYSAPFDTGSLHIISSDVVSDV